MTKTELFYLGLATAYIIVVLLTLAGVIEKNTGWGYSNIIFILALIGFAFNKKSKKSS